MHLAQALDHGLANHVVGQACEGLRAHDVGRAVLDEVDHLGREQPALAHGVAQGEDLLGLIGKLEDVLVRLEARGLRQHAVHGLARGLNELDARHVREALGGLGAQLALHVDGAREAKEEEVDKAGHVGLAAFGLDDLDQLVVGRGVELDENLSHHAHARLGAVVHKRNLVEGGDGLLADLLEAALVERVHGLLHAGHELVMQRVDRALLGLVRTRAVDALHHEVAVEKHVDGLGEKNRVLDRPAGVVFVQARGHVNRDHGDVGVAALAQCLADKGDVVGGSAAATGLGDENGRVREVVLAALDGLHDLAHGEDGRVADVVVHVLEAGVHGTLVNRGEKHQVVAIVTQHRLGKLKVHGAHLRREDSVVRLLHLLGIANLREGSALGLAVDGRATREVGLAGALERSVGQVHAHGLNLLGLALGGLLLQLLLLLLKGGHEGADADARGTQV